MATRARARRCSLCGKNHAKVDKSTREACAAASLEMFHTTITTLKEQFVGGTSFQKVMEFFLENLAKDPIFLGLGQPVRADRVGPALAHVAAKILGRSADEIQARLVSLPEHGMSHGLLKFEGGVGVVFFFHDVEKGLLALSDARERDATIYVRFHVHELPDQPHRVLH